jgi:hypothetical protein
MIYRRIVAGAAHDLDGVGQVVRRDKKIDIT